jgi:hypothetical protein
MGYYIQVPLNTNKAEQLMVLYGALKIPTGDYTDVYKNARAEGLVPVIVVQNPGFDAAAVAYSQREFDEFTAPSDTRRKSIVLMEEKTVLELCPGCPL